ncbi:Uncharacterized conserved protein [Sphingobacterium multivorum]|uniref:DUF1810 domain-containing protein n=1 Tax=Sphingobacterium multivorum TaxID=28454 RepID=UPI000DFC2008|nr:DUF1810 domain-containing protein [Sphingobacterium multivorum]QQT46086.1 DUF1810 domain-containing protein [Sphingobacterium multivorum]SUJ30818.1 Uncharacterized conserved protein [Sphingobacterium multivorum]
MELKRFLDAQNQVYLGALSEIKKGKKTSHWMWYVFPQLKGLGKSETSNSYAISDLAEANSYAAHPVLGKHLVEISEALLQLNVHSAEEIFGYPDNLKLKSCMTLFAKTDNAHTVFAEVLEKYFKGIPDERTLQMIKSEN